MLTGNYLHSVWPSSGSFFSVPSCLEKFLEWWVMTGEVPNPQYCTNVSLMFSRTSCHCRVYFTFYFCLSQYTSLCFDTVTLKKSKLCKVDSDMKKMAVLFPFAFLYMYFVPKLLFTYVNNSVSSAICSEIFTMFRIRPCFGRGFAGSDLHLWSTKARLCSIARINLSSSLHQASYEHSADLRKASASFLPETRTEISALPQSC